METEKRGLSFDKLLTIPEQDDWVYSDGKSSSCIAFVLEMYKEAGLFGSIANSIQVTEFTVDFLSLAFLFSLSTGLSLDVAGVYIPVILPKPPPFFLLFYFLMLFHSPSILSI